MEREGREGMEDREGEKWVYGGGSGGNGEGCGKT